MTSPCLSSGSSMASGVSHPETASASRFSRAEKGAMIGGIGILGGVAATPFIMTHASTIASGLSMAAAAGGGIALGTISGGGVALISGFWNLLTSLSNRLNSQFKGANEFLELIEPSDQGQLYRLKSDLDPAILKKTMYNRYGSCLKGAGGETVESLLKSINDADSGYDSPQQALEGILNKDMRFSQRRKQLSSVFMFAAAGALAGAAAGSLGAGFGAVPLAVFGGMAGLVLGLLTLPLSNKKLAEEQSLIHHKVAGLAFPRGANARPVLPQLPQVDHTAPRPSVRFQAPTPNTSRENLPQRQLLLPHGEAFRHDDPVPAMPQFAGSSTDSRSCPLTPASDDASYMTASESITSHHPRLRSGSDRMARHWPEDGELQPDSEAGLIDEGADATTPRHEFDQPSARERFNNAAMQLRDQFSNPGTRRRFSL